MDKIDPELLKRLDALTEKLGMGAGEAWRIFVHQAYVEALSWLPYLALWVLVAIVLFRFSTFCKIEATKDEDYADGANWIVGRGALLVAAMLSLLGVAACLSSMFEILGNPEAYALKEIFARLKP